MTAQAQKIHFTKMHGIGNDYIYVDLDRYPIADLPAFAIKASDRHFGIGGDGVVTYNKENEDLYRMRIFNTDGSEGLMCGNAIRCVAKLVYESGLLRHNPLRILTASGIKTLELTIDEGGRMTLARVDMGKPVIETGQFEVRIPEAAYTGTKVSMGNPHFVTFIDSDPTDYPLDLLGPKVERHEAFPNRVNFEIVKVLGSHTIKMRVYERGSGLTLACGTGACASAVAAIRCGLAKSPVTVRMPGGDLEIEWDGDENHSVFMTGPAEISFTGEVEA